MADSSPVTSNQYATWLTTGAAYSAKTVPISTTVNWNWENWPQTINQTGWICPRCQQVWSPSVFTCTCPLGAAAELDCD